MPKIPEPDPNDFRYKKKSPLLGEEAKRKIVYDALTAATENQKYGPLELSPSPENALDKLYRYEILTVLEELARENKLLFRIDPSNYGKEIVPPEEREDSVFFDQSTRNEPVYRPAPLSEDTPIRLTLLDGFDNWHEAHKHSRNRTVWDLDPDQVETIRRLCIDIDRKFRIKPETKIVLIEKESLHTTGRGDALDFLEETGVIVKHELAGHAGTVLELVVFLNIKKFKDFLGEITVAPNKETGKKSRPLPAASKWEDVVIKFTGATTAKIKVGKQDAYAVDYKDMGFEDKRKHKPNQQWEFLKLLASSGGEISWDKPDAKDTLKKKKQHLAAALKKHFKLKSDPFFPYKVEGKYKLKPKVLPESD
jgi:hypothetical protein